MGGIPQIHGPQGAGVVFASRCGTVEAPPGVVISIVDPVVIGVMDPVVIGFGVVFVSK